jgi:chromosome segregation ATPase
MEKAEIANAQAYRNKCKKYLADVNIELAKEESRLSAELRSIANYKKELSNMKSEQEREKELISKLEDQLKSEKPEREKFFDELHDFKQEYKELERNNKKLLEQVDFHKEELDYLATSKTSIFEKENEIYNMQRQIRDITYRLESERRNQATYRQQKRKLLGQLEEKTEEVIQLREESSSLILSISSAERDVNNLNAKSNEQKARQEVLIELIDKLKDSELSLQTKVANMEAAIRRESREIDSLKSHLRSLQLRVNILDMQQ